eukprot:8837259-Prorocentrum_lima.AAC.1
MLKWAAILQVALPPCLHPAVVQCLPFRVRDGSLEICGVTPLASPPIPGGTMLLGFEWCKSAWSSK